MLVPTATRRATFMDEILPVRVKDDLIYVKCVRDMQDGCVDLVRAGLHCHPSGVLPCGLRAAA